MEKSAPKQQSLIFNPLWFVIQNLFIKAVGSNIVPHCPLNHAKIGQILRAVVPAKKQNVWKVAALRFWTTGNPRSRSKAFQIQLSLFVLSQICAAITMRSITNWKIKFHMKIAKVEAAWKNWEFRLHNWLQMSSTKCFFF